jgi:predicted ferric reductase
MKSAIYRVVLSAACLALLCVVLAIPSAYETTTLWYKTGIDKAMLTAGQYVGLTALVLLYLQIILSLKPAFLSRVFGTAPLMRYHRINALLIFVMAAAHVLLVLIPEGLANLPLGKKFWPEMVGAALFGLLIATVFFSHFRRQLRLPFTVWRGVHKAAGYLALLLVTVHVVFVSESFEQPLPRISLLSFFTLTVIGTAVVKIRTWQQVRNKPPRRQS